MEYIHLYTWRDYPELSRLTDLSRPPKSLFIQGNFNPKIFERCVTVVGSRRMTNYGRQVIEKLVPKLVFEGETIVSGFMYGVDQYAHKLCVENGGKTIAVLGWGITEPLEDYDAKLAEQIIQTGGLLISEWENQKGTLWTFPVRDRIVAALSTDVYIVEAAIKSGSLITAQAANKLGRTVWAVPGPVTSKTSEGTNQLLREGLAKMWIAQDQPKVASADPLVKLLEQEPLTVNELAIKLRQPVAAVGAQLSLLVLQGYISEREGTFYVN